jgi:hypothetical protein
MSKERDRTQYQDKIMIYGPKADGTYIVEFRKADGEPPCDLDTVNRKRSDPAFPDAHALRARRP